MTLMRFIATICGLLAGSTAFAHEANSLPFGSFLAGLPHPVLGPDHFLAMVSVGIVSAQIGGRAIWTVPATFVGVMALGGLLGLQGVGLSAVEIGIACSVLALGLAIAADKRLPVKVAMAAVGLFAVLLAVIARTAARLEFPATLSLVASVIFAVGVLTARAAWQSARTAAVFDRALARVTHDARLVPLDAPAAPATTPTRPTDLQPAPEA